MYTWVDEMIEMQGKAAELEYMKWFYDNYFNDPSFIDDLCYDEKESV